MNFIKKQKLNLEINKKTMKTPYLIQRARFANRPNRKGIDQLLLFDYMGSSEFEWGALPNSLERVRENISDYVYFQYSFKKHPEKSVTVFCKKEHQDFIGDFLEQIANEEIRLKEYCDLHRYIDDSKGSDFWWDIQNDYFFWKLNSEFDLKFKQVI